MHQQRLALRQTAAFDHIGPDRESGLGQRGGLRHGKTGRHRQHLPGRRRHVFGIAATIDQRAHPVALLPLGHALPHGGHHPGHFQAQPGRCSARRRIAAHALQHVRAVHARIGHADQHLASPHFGHVALGQLQHVGIAAPAVIDVFHESYPWILGRSGRQPVLRGVPDTHLVLIIGTILPSGRLPLMAGPVQDKLLHGHGSRPCPGLSFLMT